MEVCATTTVTGRSMSGIGGIDGSAGIWGRCGSHDIGLTSIAELHLDGHWLAVAAQAYGDDAASGNFLDHPPQLAALSMEVPFRVRITSCSWSPALPAGASASTIVISAPCSSLS